ncbi:MAG: TonB family protein [Campylobacter sp.]|nr:TonB family protein [Campylobacter sp.]
MPFHLKSMIDKKVYFFGLVFSSLLHFALIFYIFYHPKYKDLAGGYSGEMGEFESVMIISDLPIGDLKELSFDSVKSELSYEAMDEINEAYIDKEIVEAFEIESEVEIVKVKKIDQNVQTHTSKKIKQKHSNKPPSSYSGKLNSIAKNNYSSSPISGDGTKISSSNLGTSNSKSKSYQGELIFHLNKFKSYPKNSLINKEEDKVVVIVKIDKDGNLMSINIKKPSKFHSLNEDAIRLFKSASPLPKPPNSMLSNGYLTFNMPIEYDIKKYLKNRR